MMEFDRETAGVLHEAYEGALRALAEAEAVLWNLPGHPGREEYIKAHTRAVVAILSKLRAPLVIQFRDLDSERRPEGPPDTELDDVERAVVLALTEEQVGRLDEELLARCSRSWRKVARVASQLFLEPPEGLPPIPVGYAIQRAQALVAAGRLEAQGDLDYMRYSEVRLPPSGAAVQG